MKEFFLLVQFLIYFTGISFAAGGGNYPGLTPNQLIYLKAAFLAVPLIGMMLHVASKHRTALCTSAAVIGENTFLMLYIVLGFVSLPLAIDSSYSFQRLAYMIFATAGLFALIVQYKNLKVHVLIYDTVIRHMTVLTFIAFIFPLYVLAKYGVANLIPGYRTALQSYLLIHPNLLASFYAHLLVFHVGCLLFLQKPRRIAHIICIVALAVLIGLLFSRSVFIALVLTFLVICPILYNLLHKKIYVILPLLLCALGLGAMVFVADTSSFLGHFTRGDNAASLATLTHRTELWRILLENVTWKTLAVGNGYSVVTKDFGVDFGTGILYGAHNAYLSILLGTGLLSLLCALGYFITYFIRIMKTRLHMPIFASVALLSSLVLFTVNCLTAEEMGVSVTVTFAYIVFMLNMLSKRAV